MTRAVPIAELALSDQIWIDVLAAIEPLVSEPLLGDGRLTGLAFETVFSAPDKLDFVRRAKSAGYFIRIFFVGTEGPEINAARVTRRVLEGGHEVPIRKIVDRWARSITNAAIIVPEVDRFYLYDNSIDNREAQLVIRAADGHVQRQYAEPPAWSVPIVGRLGGGA